MDEQRTDGTVVAASPATDDEKGHGNGAAPAQERIPVFGARKKARELAGEVARLRGELDRLGVLSVVDSSSDVSHWRARSRPRRPGSSGNPELREVGQK